MNGALGGSNLGVTGGDTTLYLVNRFGGVGAYRPRANFARVAPPAAQAVDGGDTTVYNKFRFGGGSTTNGATACP
jgi:hypothetical protein